MTEITLNDLKKINPNLRVVERLDSTFAITKWRRVERSILMSDLPIMPSTEIASLVGHSFGDGHIGKDSFTFTNNCSELIDDVINKIKTLPISNITFSKKFHKATTVNFPRLVRDILVLFGAPVGNKVKQPLDLPIWIKEGSLEIKKAFLQALFDDESTVQINSREIVLHMHKTTDLIHHLNDFFKQIKLLLEDFGIHGATITECHPHNGKNGRTLQKRLRICGTFNFIKFKESIGFVNPNKMRKLEAMIENTGNLRLRVREADEKIIGFLNNSRLNTLELKSKLGISHWATLNHLRRLERKNIIQRISHHPIPHMWQLTNK